MKTCFAGLSAVLLAASIQVVGAGDITGKVTLKGTPAPDGIIPLDPACGKLHSGPITTRHYLVSKDGGLANVFVYLQDAKPAPATAPSPVLDQIGCVYEPYVFGAVAGQKIIIKNSDPMMHNVHPTPSLTIGNKEFNFAQLKGQVNEKTFDKPEVMIRFTCNVHAWMFAYAGILDHPYFAVTDKDGKFTIPGAPDGKYNIVAYHPKTHRSKLGLSETVEVKGGAVTKDFVIQIQPVQ